MPFVNTNGVRLSYQRSGSGTPVLLIMGSSASGRVWTMHQTPALNRAGYETITFDNRGIAPSDAPDGDYTLTDLVADTRGLIQQLGLGPCHLVGTSLGAMIAQELALASPELVRSALLLATRARSDAFRRAQSAADRVLRDSGVRLPPGYSAAKTVMEMFSPATLNNDTAVTTMLELFELTGGGDSVPGQAGAADSLGDRRAALRGVTVPCRAVAFSDDLICPPHLVAEVADAIPDCDLVEIADCGHLGYLERPDEINSALVEFLGKY
ncbi:alpha/beta fold hydrolase [Streptomyces sp. SID10815]|uniref:Alpha/beta fold hydrolase n=1 Tax=Streptomyces similanensis TaxID=1274988 RepID=A0ABP9JPZ5_9ACTN|nr:alpha/beta fold hydrolase [Streptomyces sp. SID10815]NEA51235.1 alpha/beta fold hydrolase [Streptomyces sp. SID10815]QKW25524.1 alpha/beta fold hydrolase [Streptomyces seoulensis]